MQNGWRVVVAGILGLCVSMAVCQESKGQEAATNAGPEARLVDADDGVPRRDIVVVRIAEPLVRKVLSTEVQVETPVNQTVFGIRARGKAKTAGKLWVALRPDAQRGTFLVHFRGTSVSNTAGRRGPATLYTTASTSFWATKQVTFEAGRGVQAEPAKISARCATRLNAVGTTRNGIIGNVVRRAAARRFAANRAAINRLALANARQRIRDGFEKYLNWRLSKLNESLATIRPLFEAKETTDEEVRVRLCTSESYADICIGRGTRSPTIPVNHSSLSLVEVWLHSSLIHQDRPVAVREWSALADILSQLRREAVNANLVRNTEPRIKFTLASDGEWLVIGVGDEATLAANKLARSDQ